MSNRRKRKPEAYRIRSYRNQAQSAGLKSFHVQLKETDLHIQADRELKKRAEELVLECRMQLEDYGARYPQFFGALSPLEKDVLAPPLIREMYEASQLAGVGPMAAVAGGVAEYVGKKLLAESVTEIIVENGGDIFLHRNEVVRMSIFAGESPLSDKVGLEFSPPVSLGVCTSSGTVGHSLSLGEADSVTVVSHSTLLADAVATRLGNEVGKNKGKKENINQVLQFGKEIPGVMGVVIICDDLLGAVGDVELIKMG